MNFRKNRFSKFSSLKKEHSENIHYIQGGGIHRLAKYLNDESPDEHDNRFEKIDSKKKWILE